MMPVQNGTVILLRLYLISAVHGFACLCHSSRCSYGSLLPYVIVDVMRFIFSVLLLWFGKWAEGKPLPSARLELLRYRAQLFQHGENVRRVQG